MRPYLLAVALLVLPAAARAQIIDSVPQGPIKGSLSVGLAIAQPLGAFREYVKIGGGVDGSLVVNLSRDRAWGLRFDGGVVNYGSETKRTRLSNSIGDRIRVDVTTTNNIGRFGVGPQLTVPHGAIRPYLHGTVGFSYFYTQSSVDGMSADDDFAHTTNFSDFAFAYGGGGGLQFPLRAQGTPVAIDLGARYIHNGKTRYLREGSIRDNPDGSISYEPIESEVELVLWHLGVTFGFR